MIELLDLNDDVLLHIFQLCSNYELRQLCNVCRHFQHLIVKFVLPRRSRDLLMTGTRNVNTEHFKRTLNRPSHLHRLRIHAGWHTGRYAEHTLFQHRIMYPSHIHLERHEFYMSHGGEIRVHRRRPAATTTGRHKRGEQPPLDRDAHHTIGTVDQPDVTCFRRRDDVLFGGRANGDYFVYENDELTEARTLGAGGERAAVPVVAVDMRADSYVTVNRERLTLWSREYELGRPMLEPQADFDEDEYKSVCIQPDGEWVACGKYRDRERTALELIHLERHIRRTLNSRTTSVYDLRWLDAHTLLTANYDSTCRLHDTRTPTGDVLTWMDPYDAAVYTLQTDGQYGILCGMSANCRVTLYDVRQTSGFVQMFYPHMERQARGSPVYGLACDATQLFVATDHNLRVLDFAAWWAPVRDYRNIFSMVIRV